MSNPLEYDWQSFYQLNSDYQTHQKEYESLLSTLDKFYNHSIDIGCGKGRHLSLLSKYSKIIDGYDLVDYDTSVNHFYKGDIRHSFPELSTYDLVFSNGLFHHFEKKTANDLIVRMIDSVQDGTTIIFNLHSKKDSKFRQGLKISKDSYLCESGNESGQIHCFWGKNEIIQSFKNLKIQYLFESGKEGYKCWYVAGVKV
ncbi:methyltransferase domain-containing protein [Paraglaciecola arctica]|uniref:methyltransferase domain-containing protein n=1 Tax=Paraglaciecola arctica TaxID=1128911 RepID=UPI001C078BCD|nr:class I SAM-dependent methyltransferase [Paraglaciecola arctica]